MNCNSEITSNAKHFCNQSCCVDYKNRQTMLVLDSLDNFNGIGITGLRKYFKLKGNNICAICGLSVWESNPIPLILDHIDGNSDNWQRNNLRVVCPNCDALLPTYKSKNRGNGRAYRRKRYAEGKSY